MSTADIKREIIRQCQQYGLEHDCGCDGDHLARIAIVGEAPGDRETQQKVPLVGSSGRLFWDTVRKYGITRRVSYVTNVVKRQLVSYNDKYDKMQVGATELDLYSTILRWELEQLPNLEVVVCLGTRALMAITGLPSADKYRGSVLTVQLSNNRRVQVVVLNNPAAVLRQPRRALMFHFDCKRLGDVFNGTFTEHPITTRINPSFAEAIAWIDRMQSENRPVALDIEVSGGECICIGLGNNAHEAMCIPFRTQTDNYFTEEEEVKLWQRLAAFVSSPDVRLVMQNGSFDASFLWYKCRLKIESYYFDTMLAHHTLYSTMPHGLGFLCTQYTNHPYYKDESKAWKEGGSIEREWEYNCKDVAITWAVYEAELRELREQGLEDFFFNHVMKLQPHLVEMTVLGVRTDAEKREELRHYLRNNITELETEFQRAVIVATGDPNIRVNYKSPKQLADLLFSKLKLVGRGTSVDADNRRRMYEHPRTSEAAKRVIDCINKLAKATKLLSTYVETNLDEDGRMRCSYNQHGVQSAPGRLSSSSTGWGTGGNLQNIPPQAHIMYVADPGCEFSYFDLAQAEARTVAWRYNIETWKEQFERARLDGSGYDSHRALAASMFNLPYDEVPKEDVDEHGNQTMRYTAKRCRHALNYRMMPPRFADELWIPLREAERLWAIYHRTTPEIQQGWAAEIQRVMTQRMLYNAYGRRWTLLEPYSDEAAEPVIAFYHQSTIGDKVARCIYLCHNDPEWPRSHARIALNVHDCLIAINEIAVGPLVRRIMKKHAEESLMVEGIDGVKRELIIPADIKQSVPDEHGLHRWSSLRKVAV